MKNWRPQVFLGTILLTGLGGLAMWLDFEQVAICCAAGIVAAVTSLATNGKAVK